MGEETRLSFFNLSLNPRLVHVVIGGPPNSGKSTFTYGLIRLIQETLGIPGASPEFAYLTLDVWDKTLNDLLAIDDGDPAPLSEEDEEQRVEDRANRFADMVNLLVLGDLPGGDPDEYTRILAQPADAIIIVSQSPEGIETWRRFAQEQDIDVFATFETFQQGEGEEASWNAETREGRLVGLDRDRIELRHLRGFDEPTLLRMGVIADELIEAALG